MYLGYHVRGFHRRAIVPPSTHIRRTSLEIRPKLEAPLAFTQPSRNVCFSNFYSTLHVITPVSSPQAGTRSRSTPAPHESQGGYGESYALTTGNPSLHCYSDPVVLRYHFSEHRNLRDPILILTLGQCGTRFLNVQFLHNTASRKHTCE